MTMLDRMRRHKGWLKWSLALVCLAFIIFYIPDFLSQDPAATAPGDVIASVNGRSITVGSFQKVYRAQVQAYRNAYADSFNEDLLKQLGIDQQILNQMIEEEAAVVEAQRLGLQVSNSELRDRILTMPGLQENGAFIGEERYRQMLRFQRPPMTVTEFEESLRRAIMVEKLRAAVTDWMSVSGTEVEEEYRRRNEKVKLELVLVPASKFEDQVTLSDDEVAAHYEAHKRDYDLPAKRKVKYLLVDVQSLRAKVNVTPQEAENSYKQNTQQYSAPEQVRASHILLKTEGQDEAAVRAKAEALLAKARAGADFAQLATEFSEDEGSKDRGGDLDYFGRGRMVPEFEQVAFSLEPGAISDLVKTNFGFHIIKVVDKKPASTRPFSEVQTQIVEQLKWERAQAEAKKLADEIQAEIKTPADMEAVATRHALKVQESDFFASTEPVVGLGFSTDVSQRAFALDDGKVSEAIQTGQGPAFITVTGKKDPVTPPLAEVKDKVGADVRKQKATELAKQKAAELAATFRSAKDFGAAVKAAGLEITPTELVARGATYPQIGASAAVDKAVFGLDAGAVSDPITTDSGLVVAKVVEKEDISQALFESVKDSVRDELLAQKRGRFYQSYMSKAREKMKVEIDQAALERAAIA